MADKRISDLPVITSGEVSPSDLIPIVDISGFTTKKITSNDLKTVVTQELSSRVNTAEGDILSLDGRLTINEGQTSSNTSNISTIQNNIGDINQDIDDIEQDILTNVKPPINQNTSDIGLLDSRVGSAEGDILSLESAVQSLDLRIIKDARDKLVNPTVNDDSTQGYSVGSIWINQVSDTWFYCKDITAGMAVWQELETGSGAGGGSLTLSTPQNIDIMPAIEDNFQGLLTYLIEGNSVGVCVSFIIPPSFDEAKHDLSINFPVLCASLGTNAIDFKVSLMQSGDTSPSDATESFVIENSPVLGMYKLLKLPIFPAFEQPIEAGMLCMCTLSSRASVNQFTSSWHFLKTGSFISMEKK